MSNEPKTPRDLSFECELNAPPEQVWKALTQPELIEAWLMPNDFRPEPGARFSFRPEPGKHDAPITCQVLAVEPPNLLRYTWQERSESEPSLVTFQLERSAAGGTHLRLVHSESAQQKLVGQLLFLPLGAGRDTPLARATDFCSPSELRTSTWLSRPHATVAVRFEPPRMRRAA